MPTSLTAGTVITAAGGHPTEMPATPKPTLPAKDDIQAFIDQLDRERRERAWKTVDQLNAKLGRDHPHLGRRAEGFGLEAAGGVSVAALDHKMSHLLIPLA